MKFAHIDASRSFVYDYDFTYTGSLSCLQCVRQASRVGWHDTKSMLWDELSISLLLSRLHILLLQ